MAIKTFYHRVPGATFVLTDGRTISFAGGRFETDKQEFINELNKVANVASSMIYTTEEPIVSMEEKQTQGELMQAATVAFDGDRKIVGNPETIPIPVEKPAPPSLATIEAAKAAVAKATQSKPK